VRDPRELAGYNNPSWDAGERNCAFFRFCIWEDEGDGLCMYMIPRDFACHGDLLNYWSAGETAFGI
jgi:hypothetical protein